MRASHIANAVLAAAVIGVLGLATAMADDPQQAKQNQPATNNQAAQPNTQHMANDRALVIRTMPSKKVVGANVQNTRGEKLGSIDDLVIDLPTGKVQYAALSVGGVLGVGDKLFAVPFEEFKTAHDTSNNVFFVLDISKDRLEKAPGFDKNHWPDFANPEWKNQISNYYHSSSASRSSERSGAESR